MRRVLVLVSDTGAGHRSASRALIAGAAANPERGLDLVELDPYRADDPFWSTVGDPAATRTPSPAWADPVVTWYGAVIRRAPWAWGLAFRLAALPGMGAAYHAAYGRTVAARIRRAIDATGAAAVVSVHPLCNRAMAEATAGGFPCLVVVTDLVDVHPFWAGHPGARHVVATREASNALVSHAIDPARIATVGLPLRSAFERVDHTAREMRVRLGVDPDRDLVLFMGGGDGAGDLDTVVPACDQGSWGGAAREATFVVACGRNEALRRRLDSRSWRGPVRAIGFEPAIHEWMVAASVIVTKPGSLTVAEGLALGRPLLLGPPLPGQEEGNVPLVVDAGAGLAFRDAPGAAAGLRAMLADPAALWEMGQQALRLRRADATARILDIVQSMVSERQAPRGTRGDGGERT